MSEEQVQGSKDDDGETVREASLASSILAPQDGSDDDRLEAGPHPDSSNTDGEMSRANNNKVKLARGVQKRPRSDTTDVHDEIARRLRENDIHLETFAQRREFLQRYNRFLRPDKRHREDSILHTVVRCRKDGSAAVVRLLVKDCPSLMETRDRHGMTALHVALNDGQHHVVEAMLDAAADLDTTLRIQDSSQQNCVHAAIAYECPHPLLIRLIQRASEETLLGEDADGLTPLHMAVEYLRCTASQLEVVRELLKQGPNALSSCTALPGGLSPYQYHIATCTQSGWPIQGSEGQSVGLRSRLSIEGAPDISHELKLWTLRTRSEDEAKKILYGNNERGIEVSFNFLICPSSIDAEVFMTRSEYLAFADILSSVSIGNCRVDLGQKRGLLPATGTREAGSTEGSTRGGGRSDAVFFFNWLWDKSVRRILKATVEDMASPPHTEQAVENALERFRVEVLDWQRPDLCPESICKIGQDLVEVYLYWSGNNAILRAWSEPEGLPRLENLARIVLTVMDKSTSEDETRIRKNLGTFCRRMSALRPDVKTTIMATGNAQREAADNPVQRWFRCMQGFADSLTILLEQWTAGPRGRVKVALIDDGVYMLDRSLKGRIHGGSYGGGPGAMHGTRMAALILGLCPDAEIHVCEIDLGDRTEDGLPPAASISSVVTALMTAQTHGADIICMPWAIETWSTNTGDAMAGLAQELDRLRETETIVFVPRPDTGTASASHVFSAARGAAITIDALPADRVAGLTSSTPSHYDLDFQGRRLVFPGSVPVEFQGDMATNSTSTKSSGGAPSGSSVATALAAGLAAVILYCARLKEAVDAGTGGRDERKNIRLARFLRSPDGMRRVLAGIYGNSDPRPGELIPVWNLFRLDSDEEFSKGANVAAVRAVIERLGDFFDLARESEGEDSESDTEGASEERQHSGVNFSRHGSISILQVYVLPHRQAYLVDVHTLGEAALSAASPTTGRTFKDILEPETVPKVFFDVRNDSGALYSHFQIRLAGIKDLQLMEASVREYSPRFVCGLALNLAGWTAWAAAKERGRRLFAPGHG